MAAWHRKKEVFTTYWITTSVFCGLSRSFSCLCKEKMIYICSLVMFILSNSRILYFIRLLIHMDRSHVQIIRFICWKCLHWKFRNRYQELRYHHATIKLVVNKFWFSMTILNFCIQVWDFFFFITYHSKKCFTFIVWLLFSILGSLCLSSVL